MKKIILSLIFSTPLGAGGWLFSQSSTILPSSIQLPNVAAFGTCTATEKGQQVFLTTDNKSYFCNGTTWLEMSGSFALPYSGSAVANAPTHLFKLENTGSGFVAHFTINNATNPNGGLFISNLGLGFGINAINTNAGNTNPAVRGQTLGTGFAADFSSLNGTPKALKTTGGLQLTGISEGLSKVLTSDATGNATWQTLVIPTKTNYYNASNMDFLPSDAFTSNWNAFVRDNQNTRIAFFDDTRTESSFMIAPVDLPDGAIITRMKSFYIDNFTGETLFIELIRRNKTTTTIALASEDVMASNQSAGTNLATIRTAQTTTILNSTIDNLTYYYFIKVKIGDFTGDATQSWEGSFLGIRDVELQYTY